MRTLILGRKINLSDDFKKLVEEKVSKFDRIFGTETIANVKVSREGNVEKVELTIRYAGKVYRAESETFDKNEGIDNAIHIISGQMRRNKSKLEKQLKSDDISKHFDISAEPSDNLPEQEYNIVKRKKFFLKPINVEEAILEMNLVGHKFYMFRNSDTDDINVVYIRKNGSYGLLEPEI